MKRARSKSRSRSPSRAQPAQPRPKSPTHDLAFHNVPLSSDVAPWTILSHLGADIGNGAWPLMQFLNPLDRLKLMAVNKEFRKAAIDYNQNLENKMKKKGPLSPFKITFNLDMIKYGEYARKDKMEIRVRVHLNLYAEENNKNHALQALMLSPKVWHELDKAQFVLRFYNGEDKTYFYEDLKKEEKNAFLDAILNAEKPSEYNFFHPEDLIGHIDKGKTHFYARISVERL